MLTSRFTLLACFCFTLLLSGCSVHEVLRIRDRQVIDVPTMISELRPAPLVFVGERHNAASHHRLQLEVIKGLHASGRPLAIGLEMFEEGSQRALNAWSAGRAPEAALKRVYQDNWRNVPWALYRDILIYARDNRIPLIALNPPRGLVSKVSHQGFASITPEELKELPPGITAEVSDSEVAFMTSAYSGHGRSGARLLYLCQAQALRNRMMAFRIREYLAGKPESRVVVLSGGGHARGIGGIPAELAGLDYRIVLPPVPGLDAGTVTPREGDYLLEEPFSWLELLL